jgi:hypothetical protein
MVRKLLRLDLRHTTRLRDRSHSSSSRHSLALALRIINHRRPLLLLLTALLRPLRRPIELRLAPWPGIAEPASALTIARSAELLRQVLSRDLGQKLALVSATEDMDLLHSDGVEEGLNHAEDGAETPRGVDEVEAAKALGVVVLGHSGGLLDVSVDGGDLGEADALEVHDCAAGFEEVAGLARAGGEAGVGYFFVLDGEVLEHALLGGDFVHGCEVALAELLDVDGAAILGGMC